MHHHANVGEIQELIVQESERGKGIGHLLLEKVKEVARENACLQIEVSYNQKKTVSHKFYTSQGMVNDHYKFSFKLA